MDKTISDALLEFYRKVLKPEFDAIREKQTELDERFSETFDHFDALYKRLDRLEDEYLVRWRYAIS